MFIFPVQLTTSRIGNLTRLIHTLLYTHIPTYIHTYKCVDRANIRLISERALHTKKSVIKIQSSAQNAATRLLQKGLSCSFAKEHRRASIRTTKVKKEKPKTVSPTKIKQPIEVNVPHELLNSMCLVRSISKLVLLVDGRLVAWSRCLLVPHKKRARVTHCFACSTLDPRNTAPPTSSQFRLFSTQHSSLFPP